MEEEEVVPGQRVEDSTTLDENNDTTNRHELELSLLRDELDKFRSDMSRYLPLNMIAMYAGTEADIPDLWHICNGQGGTVDLRDKFVRGGAYDDIGDEGGFADIEQTLPEHVHQLDHHFHVLDPHFHTISDKHAHYIQPHTHGQVDHAHSFYVPNHTHSMNHAHVKTSTGGEHTHWIHVDNPAGDKSGYTSKAGNYYGDIRVSTADPLNHAHTIPTFTGSTGETNVSGNTGPGGSIISNTELTTDQAKSDKTDELGEVNTQTAGDGDTYPAGSDVSGTGKNLPPYYTLAFIQKVK